MTMRLALMAAVCGILAACAGNEPDTVTKDASGITFGVGYDAAVKGTDTRAAAQSHCDGFARKAVWYGHDRDGNMVYKCE